MKDWNDYIAYSLKSNLVELDILLNKHCNLKCKNCMRWCNLAKEEFYDFEDIKKDLDTPLHIDSITLNGGEPLLYPKLKELLIFLREKYPKASLQIFTNCKGFQTCDDDLLKIISDTNTGIVYSEYTLSNIDYDKVRSRLDKFNIKYYAIYDAEISVTERKLSVEFAVCPLTHNKHFSKLKRKKKCMCGMPSLWKGKLFVCPRTAFVDIVNQTNPEFNQDNSFMNLKDIKSVKDFQKIHFKVASLCEYCVTSSSKFEKWCVGKSNPIQDDFKFEI